MALNLTTTREIASRGRLKCFFYGLPGSGKTHLAGTFPAPLFICPEKIAEELATCGNAHLTTATFASVQGFLNTVSEVAQELKAGRKIGAYVPQSIAIDHTAEIQNMIEHEILIDKWKKQGQKGDFPKMFDSDWGIMYNVLMSARNTLYSIPGVHIIWIGHAKERKENVTEGGRRTTRIYREISLRGSAKEFLPNSCNVFSYLERVPKGKDSNTGQPQFAYYLYGQIDKGWNSRLQLSADKTGFLRLGGISTVEAPQPTYDQLAPYFELPPRDECEKGVEFGALTPQKEDSEKEQSSELLTKQETNPKPKPRRNLKGKKK